MAQLKKCPKCPRKFRKRGPWQRHMRNAHGAVPVWS